MKKQKLYMAAMMVLASVLLTPGSAQAHGTCSWSWYDGSVFHPGVTTPVAIGGGTINEGGPFDFNFVLCTEQHVTYELTGRLQRSSDQQNWVTDSTRTDTCGQGKSCFLNHWSATCNPGVSKWWRVKVTATIGAGGTHTPQDTGPAVYLTCS